MTRLLLIALYIWAALALPAAPKTTKTTKPALPPNPRKLAPPPGFPLPAAIRTDLVAQTAGLEREIRALSAALQTKPDLLALLPDVQVFHQAVSFALEDDIFYQTNQYATARALLQEGRNRAAQLRLGQAPWNSATGLVVRGYVSRLDDSVQPYGLVVPAGYRPGGAPGRLDLWFHGRGDTLSELAFVEGRLRSAGEFTPPGTLVLHPYGRFCNAYKFAGEVDVFEALEDVRRHYPVDENRICARGFSMGGAAAWHLGAHHAWRWAAINPGAGFVDVKNYQKLGDKLASVPGYEQALWNLYDPLACALNLVNSTLVAYSGEEDTQKAAADLMEKALAQEGVKMTHIIGPKTGHKYEPLAKKQVAALVDAAARQGRATHPPRVRFVTWSLKYPRMHWVEITGLEKHWEKAEVDAEIKAPNEIRVKTRNISGLKLEISGGPYRITIDGQLPASPPRHRSDPTHPLLAFKTAGQWQLADREPPATGLAKRHNLQGPIDDAFMDAFIMVCPTGQPLNPTLGQWTKTEMQEAIFQWRRQFRGMPRVKNDTAITEEDILNHHLVLWGDPAHNRLLAKIMGQLPVQWTAQGLVFNGKTYDPAKAGVALIFPNPLQPKRYVVLNSGFTFPQYGTTSNSYQTPKLPDWAILDLSVPIAERLDGRGILAAGFFDEQWRVRR